MKYREIQAFIYKTKRSNNIKKSRERLFKEQAFLDRKFESLEDFYI